MSCKILPVGSRAFCRRQSYSQSTFTTGMPILQGNDALMGVASLEGLRDCVSKMHTRYKHDERVQSHNKAGQNQICMSEDRQIYGRLPAGIAPVTSFHQRAHLGLRIARESLRQSLLQGSFHFG